MPDGIVLSEQDRAKLDGIVQKMIANKESEDNIRFVVDDFKNKYGLKKKGSSEPTSQEKSGASPTRPTQQGTLSDTEPPTRAQASVALGGPTKLFGQEEEKRPTSIMYGNEPKKEGFVPPSTPIDTDSSIKYLEKKTKIKLGQKFDVEEQERNRKELERLKAIKKKTPIEEPVDDTFTYQFNNVRDLNNYTSKAKEEVDAEVNNTGFLNVIKSGLSSAYNTVVSGIGKLADLTPQDISAVQIEKNPIAKEISEVKSDFKNSKLTEEEVNFKAYQLAIENKAKSLRNSQTDDYLESIPEDVKDNLQFNKVDELKTIDDNTRKVVKVRDFYIASLENDYIRLNQLQQTNQDPNEIANVENRIKSNTEYIKKLDKSIYGLDRKHGSAEEEVDLLKRNYDMLYNFSGRVTQQTLNTLVSTADMIADFALIGTPRNSEYINKLKKSKDELVTETVNDINSLTNDFRKDISEVNNVNDFMNWSSDVFGVQLPTLVAASTSGGLGVIGATSMAQKRVNMKQEVLNGTAKYDDLQMLGVPLLWGTFDVVSELPTVGILKKAGLATSAINADNVLKRELVNSTFNNFLKTGKGYSKDQFKENAGELFTNVSQNALDKYLLGKKEVGIFDNSEDILKDTFLMTSMLQSSPHIAGAVIKPFATPEYTNTLDNNSKQILNLNKLIGDKNVSEEVKSVAKNKIAGLNAESGAIVNKVVSSIDSMSDAGKSRIAKIEKEQSELRAKASEITQDKTVDVNTKKDLLNSLKSQFKLVEDERINILSGKTTAEEMSVNAPAEIKIEEVTPVEVKEIVAPKSLANEYIESIEKVKSENPEMFWSVDRPFQNEDGTINEDKLNKAAEEGRLIKTEAGFGVVGEDGDIKGVFKSDVNSTEKTGDKVIQEAVKAGGIKLDNFALPNLMKIYERNGFREVSRLPFNKEYAPEGWTEAQGTPDVVAMVYDPEGKLNIENKSFTDYDEAMNYRDSYVEEAKKLQEVPTEVAAVEEIKPSDIETTLDEVITPASKDVKEQVSRAKRAISKFLPNVEIIYHTTADSYKAVVGDNSRGYYEGNKIHINGSNANSKTVAHEVFHAVILKNITSNKQATDLTNRMLKALSKSLKSKPENMAEINKFVEEGYSNDLWSEEKLAEVIGYLASEYETLPDVSKNIIQKWIENIAKMVGIKKFTDQEVVDFMNTLATRISTGQEITETDVKAIIQGSSTYIAEPTEINRSQKVKEEKVKVGDHKLSFVKESDLIDIDSLMKEISDKKEKVWFWVADQLGRGDYYDSVIDGEHYLDAGPSFALDPENRSKNIIWATGKAEKEITKLISNSDYIFIISGSPLKSKLFNKSVIDIISKRAGDFNSFKKNILNASKIKPLNDVLSSVNSWEELRDTPKRKEFLLNVLNQADKNTPLKKELEKYNSIIDLNELRDGFYADNNFELNDIMLVLKPTEFGGKSNHSTYENNILGEVVGVPDIKVNAFDILPSEIKDKYKGELGKSQQQQAVAPYGIGVKPIERRQIPSDYKAISKEILTDKELNTVRASLRASMPNSFALEVLDAVSKKEVLGYDLDLDDAIEKMIQDGISINNVANILMQDEDLVENKDITSKKKAVDYILNIGLKGTVLKSGQRAVGRKQLSPIDQAVKVAKNKGFNDKEIADYLVSKGYTRAQATKAILRYNDITSVKLRKEDSVFTKEGRNKIITFLDQIKRRALSARSFLPKSVFLSKDKIESNIKAEAKRASYLVNDFNKLVKGYKGDVNALNDEFDKYLRGDQTAVLPDEFKAVAGKMRMHIDNLSQMLLRTGAVSVSQAETIAKNLGQYVNRSYQVFDKKDWAKQVTEEMREAAKVDLRNMYRAEAESKAKQTGMDADIILEDFINKKIEDLIGGESAATFLGISKTGAKNLSIMKERLDIPLSIRQLMGEYTDASQNYARTVLKIATLAENSRFLQSARESGMGVFFFNENDPNRPKEFNTKIAGDKSDTMSPLNGLYTTPEIAKAFAQKIGTGDAIEAALGTELGPVVRGVYETYMKALSAVKWLKTIGSVATHAKNVTGNLWFMLSNGYYNPKKYAEAFSVLKNSSNEQLRDKLDEYIRAGIIDQSAALGEIKAMFADADFDTAIESRLKKNPFDKAKAGVKKLGQKMTTAYQLEDDFFKIISYESEKARYSNASFDKPFNELTTEEQNIIKEKASEITKNVLPNYARIPGLVKLLKAVPVTGTFVSFQAEAYRTAWNTVALAADELRSDNKKIKAIGALRLSGIAMSQAAKFGLMALMGTIVSGGDDDEDDELKKNTKLFVAPWSKDSDLVLVNYGGGKMSYIDFSASDPHGGIKKAYNSVMAGKDITESFTNGLTQLLEPFMKEDMLLNVITDIKDNKNAYGGKLYNESDTDTNKINAIMGRVYKAFEPGTITSIRKVVGSDDVRNELAGQLTGYKISTVDVNKQLGFKMNELKDLSGDAKKLYSSAFYKFEDGTITGDELDKTYEQANKSQKEVYEKMMDYMNAASFLGVDDYMIEDNMQGVGKSVINDLWYGETPDMKMKEVEE
jgi:hypothetical protein